jgi:hypothetical protein
MNRAALVAEAEAIRARLADIDPDNLTTDQADAFEADAARYSEIEADVAKLDERAAKIEAIRSGEIKTITGDSRDVVAPTVLKRSADRDLYDIEGAGRSSSVPSPPWSATPSGATPTSSATPRPVCWSAAPSTRRRSPSTSC